MKRIFISSHCLYCHFYLQAAMAMNDHSHQQEKTDSSYAIIGKVTGQDSGWIYLIHRQTGKTDSAALDHGFFKFNGKADTAEICRISLNDQVEKFFPGKWKNFHADQKRFYWQGTDYRNQSSG